MRRVLSRAHLSAELGGFVGRQFGQLGLEAGAERGDGGAGRGEALGVLRFERRRRSAASPSPMFRRWSTGFSESRPKLPSALMSCGSILAIAQPGALVEDVAAALEEHLLALAGFALARAVRSGR